MKLSAKKLNQGFTIIEVMIVLAIAGLILAIVFLAVPTLQRNSRNTSIKSDAANIAGGIADYEANNNGARPTTITIAPAGQVNFGAGNTSTIKVNGSTTMPGPLAGVPNPPLAAGTVGVRFGFTCANTPSARTVAVYFSTESNGNNPLVQQCIDS